VAASIAEQGGPRGLESKQIVALVAYLQRLGTDIKKLPPAKAAPQGQPQAQTGAPRPEEAVATKGVVP
jgi:cytochrome c oxidase cbb3-type subunit I/II